MPKVSYVTALTDVLDLMTLPNGGQLDLKEKATVCNGGSDILCSNDYS